MSRVQEYRNRSLENGRVKTNTTEFANFASEEHLPGSERNIVVLVLFFRIDSYISRRQLIISAFRTQR